MTLAVVELKALVGRPAVRTKPAAGFVVAVWLVIGRRPHEPIASCGAHASRRAAVRGHGVAIHRVVAARAAAVLVAVNADEELVMLEVLPVRRLEDGEGVRVAARHPNVEAGGTAVLVRVAARTVAALDAQDVVELALGLDAVERAALVVEFADRRTHVDRGRCADRGDGRRRRWTGSCLG